MLVSAGLTVKIHKWPSSSPISDIEYLPHSEVPIKQISLCNDNTYLAYLQENKKCQIISLKDEANIHLVHTISRFTDLSAICFKHFTKRNLALGTDRGEVIVYDTKLRDEVKRFKNLDFPVSLIEFAGDDQQICVSSESNVVVYNTGTDSSFKEFQQPSFCTALKFNPRIYSRFAVGCSKGSVAIWDINNNIKLLSSKEHLETVTGIAYARTANALITSGKDHKICIINENTSKTEFRMNLQLPVVSLDLSKDDKSIAAGLEDGSLHFYDLRKPVLPLKVVRSQIGPVLAIAFENCENQDYELFPLEMSSRKSNTEVTGSVDSGSKYGPCADKLSSVDSLKNQVLEKIRRDIFRFVKAEVDEVENQMEEHFVKFQSFVHNEITQLHRIVRGKWDIFNIADNSKPSSQTYMTCLP